MSTHPQDPFEETSQEHHAPDEVLRSPIVEAYTDERQFTEDRYAFLPHSLHGRIPEVWILLLEKNNRAVVQITLLTVAMLTLFSTIIGPPHRAELISLLTAALAPIAFTAWNILFPLNPYQTFFFSKQGLHNLDQRDPAAKELVATLSSPAAGQFLWKRTQLAWIVFAAPMLIVILLLHRIPAIAADASWLIRVPIFCAALYAVYRIELFHWACRVMKNSEPAKPAKEAATGPETPEPPHNFAGY